MKRMVSILLVAALMLCLCACGQTDKAPDSAKENTTSATDTTSTTEGETTTTTVEDSTTGTTTTAADTSATTTTTGGNKTTAESKNTTTASQWGNWEPPVPPQTTAEATEGTTKPQPKKSIRILAVGNSFSVDAMQLHLYWMLEAAGYNDIVLGNLYIGGCSLDIHYNNIKNGKAAYEFRVTTDGFWETKPNVKADVAFSYADWDVVTLQQASPDSGRPDSYANLTALAQMVQEKAKPKKLLWHMTWAYQQNSDHWAFAQYGKDQMTMYNAIVDTMTDKVLSNSLIDGIIPCGTAVQNLRTSKLGDTLTADGYHLSDRIGDYVASLTWFAVITGNAPAEVGYCPGYVDDYFDDMAASVENAITKPTAVTPCK